MVGRCKFYWSYARLKNNFTVSFTLALHRVLDERPAPEENRQAAVTE